MDKNISNEKKPLRLKVKTFVDLRRFTSKQLHKIVENFRAKNKAYEAKYKDMSALDYMKAVKRNELLAYKVRNSLVNLSDKQAKKSRAKLQEKWNKGRESLQEKLDNEEITEKQYKNKKEQLIYKTSKEMYARDMLGNREKPKNPRTQRIIKNVKNAAKTVGKGIITAFTAVNKGAKAVVKGVKKGVKKIGRGANVALLTAGKVKNQVQTLKTQAEREMFENSSKEVQDEIKTNAHAKALKENAKRDREAARRENLHMDKEVKSINHKEAIEKAEGEILTTEEVKKVYGDQEK